MLDFPQRRLASRRLGDMPSPVLLVCLLFTIFLQVIAPHGSAWAEPPGVTAVDAWARASAGAATSGAAYVTLVGGAAPDRLVSVSTPIASAAEVHETINDNGVMKMRAVPGVPLSAGQSVTFAPGSYHIMLTGLKQPLVAGQSFPLTLAFAHAPPVTLDVLVRAIGGHEQMHMK